MKFTKLDVDFESQSDMKVVHQDLLRPRTMVTRQLAGEKCLLSDWPSTDVDHQHSSASMGCQVGHEGRDVKTAKQHHEALQVDRTEALVSHEGLCLALQHQLALSEEHCAEQQGQLIVCEQHGKELQRERLMVEERRLELKRQFAFLASDGRDLPFQPQLALEEQVHQSALTDVSLTELPRECTSNATSNKQLEIECGELRRQLISFRQCWKVDAQRWQVLERELRDDREKLKCQLASSEMKRAEDEQQWQSYSEVFEIEIRRLRGELTELRDVLASSDAQSLPKQQGRAQECGQGKRVAQISHLNEAKTKFSGEAVANDDINAVLRMVLLQSQKEREQARRKLLVAEQNGEDVQRTRHQLLSDLVVISQKAIEFCFSLLLKKWGFMLSSENIEMLRKELAVAMQSHLESEEVFRAKWQHSEQFTENYFVHSNEDEAPRPPWNETRRQHDKATCQLKAVSAGGKAPESMLQIQLESCRQELKQQAAENAARLAISMATSAALVRMQAMEIDEKKMEATEDAAASEVQAARALQTCTQIDQQAQLANACIAKVSMDAQLNSQMHEVFVGDGDPCSATIFRSTEKCGQQLETMPEAKRNSSATVATPLTSAEFQIAQLEIRMQWNERESLEAAEAAKKGLLSQTEEIAECVAAQEAAKELSASLQKRVDELTQELDAERSDAVGAILQRQSMELEVQCKQPAAQDAARHAISVAASVALTEMHNMEFREERTQVAAAAAQAASEVQAVTIAEINANVAQYKAELAERCCAKDALEAQVKLQTSKSEVRRAEANKQKEELEAALYAEQESLAAAANSFTWAESVVAHLEMRLRHCETEWSEAAAASEERLASQLAETVEAHAAKDKSQALSSRLQKQVDELRYTLDSERSSRADALALADANATVLQQLHKELEVQRKQAAQDAARLATSIATSSALTEIKAKELQTERAKTAEAAARVGAQVPAVSAVETDFLERGTVTNSLTCGASAFAQLEMNLQNSNLESLEAAEAAKTRLSSQAKEVPEGVADKDVAEALSESLQKQVDELTQALSQERSGRADAVALANDNAAILQRQISELEVQWKQQTAEDAAQLAISVVTSAALLEMQALELQEERAKAVETAARAAAPVQAALVSEMSANTFQDEAESAESRCMMAVTEAHLKSQSSRDSAGIRATGLGSDVSSAEADKREQELKAAVYAEQGLLAEAVNSLSCTESAAARLQMRLQHCETEWSEAAAVGEKGLASQIEETTDAMAARDKAEALSAKFQKQVEELTYALGTEMSSGGDALALEQARTDHLRLHEAENEARWRQQAARDAARLAISMITSASLMGMHATLQQEEKAESAKEIAATKAASEAQAANLMEMSRKLAQQKAEAEQQEGRFEKVFHSEKESLAEVVKSLSFKESALEEVEMCLWTREVESLKAEEAAKKIEAHLTSQIFKATATFEASSFESEVRSAEAERQDEQLEAIVHLVRESLTKVNESLSCAESAVAKLEMCPQHLGTEEVEAAGTDREVLSSQVRKTVEATAVEDAPEAFSVSLQKQVDVLTHALNTEISCGAEALTLADADAPSLQQHGAKSERRSRHQTTQDCERVSISVANSASLIEMQATEFHQDRMEAAENAAAAAAAAAAARDASEVQAESTKGMTTLAGFQKQGDELLYAMDPETYGGADALAAADAYATILQMQISDLELQLKQRAAQDGARLAISVATSAALLELQATEFQEERNKVAEEAAVASAAAKVKNESFMSANTQTVPQKAEVTENCSAQAASMAHQLAEPSTACDSAEIRLTDAEKAEGPFAETPYLERESLAEAAKFMSSAESAVAHLGMQLWITETEPRKAFSAGLHKRVDELACATDSERCGGADALAVVGANATVLQMRISDLELQLKQRSAQDAARLAISVATSTAVLDLQATKFQEKNEVAEEEAAENAEPEVQAMRLVATKQTIAQQEAEVAEAEQCNSKPSFEVQLKSKMSALTAKHTTNSTSMVRSDNAESRELHLEAMLQWGLDSLAEVAKSLFCAESAVARLEKRLQHSNMQPVEADEELNRFMASQLKGIPAGPIEQFAAHKSFDPPKHAAESTYATYRYVSESCTDDAFAAADWYGASLLQHNLELDAQWKQQDAEHASSVTAEPRHRGTKSATAAATARDIARGLASEFTNAAARLERTLRLHEIDASKAAVPENVVQGTGAVQLEQKRARNGLNTLTQNYHAGEIPANERFMVEAPGAGFEEASPLLRTEHASPSSLLVLAASKKQVVALEQQMIDLEAELAAIQISITAGVQAAVDAAKAAIRESTALISRQVGWGKERTLASGLWCLGTSHYCFKVTHIFQRWALAK